MPKSRGPRSSLSGLIPTTSYHSAHHPALDGLPAVTSWRNEQITAFTHDLMSSPELPGEYGWCDVLVADLPWQRGFDVFNQRAGVGDGRTYSQFMARVAEIVESTTAPTYLITGRHALTHLPDPNVLLPMMLNEHEAVAIGYRPGPEAAKAYGLAPEFLYELTRHYSVAGDFCCGYGRTARVFARAGRHAVVSDANPHCIGYIADQAGQWVAA